jgi:hypothetical protein
MSIKEMETQYDIRLIATQDDAPVRGNALASGNEEEDRRYEDMILERLDNGDVWAWADVEVQATLPDGRTGSAYLGGCSYDDENNFKEGGYYEDMVLSAVEDAKAKPIPKIPCGEEPFLQDLLSFVAYVHRNTDMDDSKKLSLIVTTLMHDLGGIIDGDTHFLPRVNGYRSKYPLI